MLKFVIVFVGVFVFAIASVICAAITEKTTGEKKYSGYNGIADPHPGQKKEKTTMCSGYNGIADPHPGQKINNSIWDSIW